MGSNASGAICALPECQRPCFEERGGFVYDYCGRSHAEEMRRRRQSGGADRQLGAYGEKGSGNIGDHPYPMTGVDPWGPFDHSPGAGSGYRAGGNGGGRVDASLVRTTDDFVLFWQEPACFVQWTACTFEVQGVRYCTAEQFMMARKAVEFGDSEAHQQIMATSDPREQKALGRRVKGFVPAVWDKVGYGVVVEGNLAKFRQNPHFRDELLATGDRILAEASPYDKEWGIGLHVDDPNALVQARWKGKNKLGMALMEVRFILQKERKEKEGKAEDEGYDKEEGTLRCCLFFKRDNRVCGRGRA